MSIAVITTVAGRHDHLRLQLSGLAASGQRPDLHVVVAMDDPDVAAVCGPAATIVNMALRDGRLPIAAARNAGAERALAEGADMLVFLDVDCVPARGLLERYAAVARAAPDALLSGTVAYLPPPPIGGYRLDELAGLALGHPARPVPADDEVTGLDHTMFWSLSFALRAATWSKIGGFHDAYTGYGGEDTDFAELARTRQVAHLAVGGAWAYHQWHPVADPPLPHVYDIVRNGRLFRNRWGWWPMQGWLAAFADLRLVERNESTDDWTIVGNASVGVPCPLERR